MSTPHVSRDQLVRFARDVAVLWDEAQDNPTLLRFLAPFGRPDLGRIERRFLSVDTVNDLVSEAYPVFATWLATMVLRAGGGVSSHEPSVVARGIELHSSLVVEEQVELPPDATVVIAGSLDAPLVRVRGNLVVAGDVQCRVLIADGCVLIGGRLLADFISAPATRLLERTDTKPRAALGLQVARSVQCRVFDSPRFGLSCPIDAEVITHAVGLAVTPDAGERLRALVAKGVTVTDVMLDFDQLARRVLLEQPLLASEEATPTP